MAAREVRGHAPPPGNFENRTSNDAFGDTFHRLLGYLWVGNLHFFSLHTLHLYTTVTEHNRSAFELVMPVANFTSFIPAD